MIIDTLTNADKYAGLHRNFSRAFQFIKNTDLANIEPGKYPIEGNDIHAAVSLKEGLKAQMPSLKHITIILIFKYAQQDPSE